MLTAVRNLYVKASAEQVWGYLRSPRNIVEWWPNCEEIHDGQPHADGGFAFEWTSKPGGVRCREEVEEMVAEPGEGITLHIAGDISGCMYWQVRRDSSRTQVTFESRYDLPVRSLIANLSPVRLLRFEQHEADAIAARVREHFDKSEMKPRRLRTRARLSKPAIAR